VLCELAELAGVLDRVVVVHADLRDPGGPDVEWPGTLELARDHAAAYGLRFEVVHRITKDGRRQGLLGHIEERGRFPSAAKIARYCTADMKIGPCARLDTRLAAEARASGATGPVRILDVLGIRAEESADREAMLPFRHDGSATCPCTDCQALPPGAHGNGRSNSRKHIDRWFPIHHWTTAQTFDRCRSAPTQLHPAYTLGFPRASCVFCILASRSALVRACQLMPDLAAYYAALEQRIGHTIQHGFSITQAIALAEQADGPVPVAGWKG
jgi:3'-phosphoadenosine 5'-phosphosulfate sulfotransferase (PAPS reductase)/FAD synthetase